MHNAEFLPRGSGKGRALETSLGNSLPVIGLNKPPCARCVIPDDKILFFFRETSVLKKGLKRIKT